jgi:glutathione synthase/RimK-type ligase-like ATP-grasp enzyme
MAKPEAIGVYREQRFSPGKVADDRAIIDLVAAELRRAALPVRMLDGDRLPRLDGTPAIVFAMCQGDEAVAWLDEAAKRAPVVNHPDSIRACYRMNLVEKLAAAGVPQPRYAVASDRFPGELGAAPWLKRGDVHAMEAADVRRVPTGEEWAAMTADFSQRGIHHAIVQAHVEGIVYKFYGVTGGFFRAFGLPAGREAEAAKLAARAAAALGLDVYGGDGVASPDGSLTLIDVNDWPSFSRCRDDAARAIGRRIVEILEGNENR